MKRKVRWILIGLIILPIFLFSPMPVSAFSFTATEYWFFIDQPQTISGTDMKFGVENTDDYQVNVSCSYETIEGIDLEVHFEWETAILDSNTQLDNHYSITVKSNFSITHNLRIFIKYARIGESNLNTGGIVLNKITYYSEDDGALLDLRIVDQSNVPLESIIEIKYKINDSYSYSPFKLVNGTGFLAYVPRGKYLLQARHIDTSIFGKTEVDVNNDTVVSLVLALVGFSRFKYADDGLGNIGLNGTITNHVEELRDLVVTAELLCNGEVISTTQDLQISRLEKTSGAGFEFVMWFKEFEWITGKYAIKGYLFSGGLTIATGFVEIGSYKKENPSLITITPELAFVSVICVIAISLYIRERMKQRKGSVKTHAKDQ